MMPHVDGWEMLRQIQERYGVGSIPVLMFSGQVDDAARRQAASSGATRLRRQGLRPRGARRPGEGDRPGLAALVFGHGTIERERPAPSSFELERGLGQVFGRTEHSGPEEPERAEQGDVEPDPARSGDEVRVRNGDQPDEDEDHGERAKRDQDRTGPAPTAGSRIPAVAQAPRESASRARRRRRACRGSR